mgnify:CR=1 FL=1
MRSQKPLRACNKRFAPSSTRFFKQKQVLRTRGVGFVESGRVHSEDRGALTQTRLGGVSFELVHHVRG